jgi:hypothetical protein
MYIIVGPYSLDVYTKFIQAMALNTKFEGITYLDCEYVTEFGDGDNPFEHQPFHSYNYNDEYFSFVSNTIHFKILDKQKQPYDDIRTLEHRREMTPDDMFFSKLCYPFTENVIMYKPISFGFTKTLDKFVTILKSHVTAPTFYERIYDVFSFNTIYVDKGGYTTLPNGIYCVIGDPFQYFTSPYTYIKHKYYHNIIALQLIYGEYGSLPDDTLMKQPITKLDRNLDNYRVLFPFNNKYVGLYNRMELIEQYKKWSLWHSQKSRICIDDENKQLLHNLQNLYCDICTIPLVGWYILQPPQINQEVKDDFKKDGGIPHCVRCSSSKIKNRKLMLSPLTTENFTFFKTDNPHLKCVYQLVERHLKVIFGNNDDLQTSVNIEYYKL